MERSLTLNDADESTEMPEECSKKLKASKKKIHNLAATEVKHTIGDSMQCERFSSFRRLVRKSHCICHESYEDVQKQES